MCVCVCVCVCVLLGAGGAEAPLLSVLTSERAVTRSGDKRVKSLSWNTDP